MFSPAPGCWPTTIRRPPKASPRTFIELSPAGTSLCSKQSCGGSMSEDAKAQDESPVADNDVMDESADTVPADHVLAASSRGRIDTGVTPGMQIASAWAWRFLVVVAAIVVLGYAMQYLSEVVVPVTVGILLTALLVPITNGLQRL